jgi:hypothetical protein
MLYSFWLGKMTCVLFLKYFPTVRLIRLFWSIIDKIKYYKYRPLLVSIKQIMWKYIYIFFCSEVIVLFHYCANKTSKKQTKSRKADKAVYQILELIRILKFFVFNRKFRFHTLYNSSSSEQAIVLTNASNGKADYSVPLTISQLFDAIIRKIYKPKNFYVF